MILEGGQNVSVGQPRVGVRMHIAIHVAKSSYQPRLQRLAQVKQAGLSALKRVRQQKATRRHLCFCVMRLSARTGNSNGSNHLSVFGRVRVSIDDGKKIFVFFCVITAPDKDVRILLSKSSSREKDSKQGRENSGHHVGDSALAVMCCQ